MCQYLLSISMLDMGGFSYSEWADAFFESGYRISFRSLIQSAFAFATLRADKLTA